MQKNRLLFGVAPALAILASGSNAQVVQGNGWIAHRVQAEPQSHAPTNRAGERGESQFVPVWVADAPNCGGTQVVLNVLPGGPYTDWGDIAFDTAIRRIELTFVTTVPDEGEPGVPGYGLTLFFFDSVNGTQGTPVLVNSIHIDNLPGTDPNPPIIEAAYQLQIDLVGDLDDESFELGDTDGVTNTANFNPFGGVDLDHDELHDFGYAIQFDLPDDLLGSTAVLLSGPEFGPPPAAQGVGPDMIGPDGLIIEGGNCESSDSDPFLQIAIGLGAFGNDRQCSEADLAPPFGVLNFFDVAAFLNFFSHEDPRADFAPPEGVFDFFDVAEFLDVFSQGCP